MDKGAWGAIGHGVAKSQTRLSDYTFHFTFTTPKAGGNAQSWNFCAVPVFHSMLPTQGPRSHP